ncbi:unnamed protein product [Rotaria socialis]|uniref:Methyltransferase domain-containing protein n=1 Tax=Rotaria socialis TaxID=392032 RepID=A0A817PUN8_9BILA|nr:unnamed protein product [Rotaria socialis]CAF3455140.1 unnamed protein product [Rotaria socialis]CAF4401773.1 unnamed protein product [Rotaria socialis]CAF4493581.1 unnamed protein product [Rotaria socialis]
MSTSSISPKVQLAVIVLLSILLIWTYKSCSPLPVSQSTVPALVNSLLNISLNDTNCQLSLVESDGYFCELDSAWIERKHVYSSQDKENMKKRPDTIYFVSTWEPNFHCSHARRMGIMGDGGKWVCDVYRLRSRDDCLIYSAGSSGDFAFEIEMKKFVPNCEIHTFDKNLYVCPTNVCTFHQVIFGDGIQPDGSKSWTSIIQELKHTNRFIEILKIDIEGGEYAFFPILLNSNKNLLPRQILIEVHPTNVTLVHAFFERLRSNNYVIFSKENNLYAGPYFFEFAFLKLNPSFFNQSHNNNTHK